MLAASGCCVLHLFFYLRENNSPRALHICCTAAHLRHHHPIKSSSPKTLKHNSSVHYNLRQISLTLSATKPTFAKCLDSSQTILKIDPQKQNFCLDKTTTQQFLLAASVRSDFFSSSSFFKS
jgi:hypothetical protein